MGFRQTSESIDIEPPIENTIVGTTFGANCKSERMLSARPVLPRHRPHTFHTTEILILLSFPALSCRFQWDEDRNLRCGENPVTLLPFVSRNLWPRSQACSIERFDRRLPFRTGMPPELYGVVLCRVQFSFPMGRGRDECRLNTRPAIVERKAYALSFPASERISAIARLRRKANTLVRDDPDAAMFPPEFALVRDVAEDL